MAGLAAGVKRSFATMAMDSTSLPPVYERFPESRSQRSSRPTSGRSSVASDALDEHIPQSRSSPPSHNAQHPLRTPPSLEPDASFVLVGIRGTGKSTLAVIASSAMKRRIVDADVYFQKVTGLSCAAFKRRYGSLEHQRQQAWVIHDMMKAHPKNCILVCNWMDRTVQAELAKFSESHLVIHIARDSQGLRYYLKVEEENKMNDLLDVSGSVFRSCSNYEFFNISENPLGSSSSSLPSMRSAPESSASSQPLVPPYLTLKRAERHFLKFMSLITAKGAIPFVESAYPLAAVPTEDRLYTYALSIPISKVSANQVDIEEMETGADAVELIVDDDLGNFIPYESREPGKLRSSRKDSISHALSQIRRNTVIPIIYHVPFPKSLAVEGTARSLYLDYLSQGLRLAAEYLVVDLRLDDVSFSEIIQAKGKTKVIGALDIYGDNLPPWADDFWISAFERARKLGCDLVKFTRPADVPEDNFEVGRLKDKLHALQGPRIPIIAYSTGRLGRTSACFNRVLTSVAPEASEEDHPKLSVQSYTPPSLTARQATEALYASFLFDHMRTYVIGASVDYSLSPAMHNAAFKACGIPFHYRPHSTPTLSSIHPLVNDPHFAGSSVGLPFKVEIIALTHSLSRHARAIGAVNTLIPVRRLNADGSIPEDATFISERSRAGPVKALYGENTDWIGIRACIRRGLSPANAVKPGSCGLIVGAGGMARAAVYSMLQLGVKHIVIFNRTYANAEKLVTHFTRLLERNDLPLLNVDSEAKTRFHIIRSRDDPWPDSFRFPTVVVSCVPTNSIGSSPAADFTMPTQWLKSPTGGVVLELGYKDLATPLLEQIRAETHRGWVPMDGYDLLPEQGFAQFELFTGRRAPRRLMRMEVSRQYKQELKRSNLRQMPPRVNSIDEQEP